MLSLLKGAGFVKTVDRYNLVKENQTRPGIYKEERKGIGQLGVNKKYWREEWMER